MRVEPGERVRGDVAAPALDVDIAAAVDEALAGLGLGEGFDLAALVRRVEGLRRHPLRIVELADLAARDGVCALWLVTDREDLILHARSDSVLHRQQFILHELAHMILGHDVHEAPTVDDRLLPDLPAVTVTKMLARHTLDCEVEIAAEYLADRLAAALRRGAARPTPFLEVFG